ncbi:hypothetical protein BH24BAC1_BH24BAC1_40830 [soil metagenome]
MKKIAILFTFLGGLTLGACNDGAGTTGTRTSQESQQMADTTRSVYSNPGFMGADTAGQVLGTPTQTESESRGGQGGVGTGRGSSEVLEAGGTPTERR